MNRIDEELNVAARENNLSEVRRLLSVGADVNATNTEGWTPLHKATYHGYVLHACLRANLAVVIELLSHGANTDAKDNQGYTPLHFAAIKGIVEIVQALLSRGAVLASNNDGYRPIYFAIREGNSAVAKCLLQHFYATTTRLPLHELLEDLTWIRTPLDSLSLPPLYEALDRNVLGTGDVVKILEYLVDQHPELLSSRDEDGLLPLHAACRRGAPFTIVQSLVNHYKASVKSRTPQGDLPLFLACEMKETSLDTIFLLMKLYPDFVYHHLDEVAPRFCLPPNIFFGSVRMNQNPVSPFSWSLD
jgi:ankyrin repeat protein